MVVSYNLPFAEGSNATAFVKAMMQRPGLPQQVKRLELVRTDHCYKIRKALGFSDWRNDDLTKLAAAAPAHLPRRELTDAIYESPASVID